MNRFFCRDEEVEIRPCDVGIDLADGSFYCKLLGCGGPVDVLLEDGEIEQPWEAEFAKWLAWFNGHWRGRMSHDLGMASLIWEEMQHGMALLEGSEFDEEADDEMEW